MKFLHSVADELLPSGVEVAVSLEHVVRHLGVGAALAAFGETLLLDFPRSDHALADGDGGRLSKSLFGSPAGCLCGKRQKYSDDCD
jgi:hypothetical protein